MANMARILCSIFGVLFLVISVPMLLGGVVALSVPAAIADDQGYMNSPMFHLQSANSYAFVSQSFSMDSSTEHSSTGNNENLTINYAYVNFEKIVNLRFKADSYFLGLAPSDSVNQYLHNVSYTVVDEINEQSISSHTINADINGSLVSTPSNQSFWIASGNDVLYYTPKSSDFNKNMTFVIMKTDGSKGIDTNFQIGVNSPILEPIGIALLIFGSLFLVFAIIFIVVAVKSKDNSTNRRYVPIHQYYQPVTAESVFLTKYCSSCGTQSDEKAHFCVICGSSFD